MIQFFGGGSFEFYIQNKYNFWKQVKNDKTVLCDELRKISSITKDDFINYRKIIMTLNDDVFTQAL